VHSSDGQTLLQALDQVDLGSIGNKTLSFVST
jgi:hypothetical protein